MQNLPKFFGDQHDKVDSLAHLEALDDYLRAYHLDVGKLPEDIDEYEGIGQDTLDECKMIFEKFQFSLQGEAKTWFHELDNKITKPPRWTVGDWEKLRELFLKRFNPYGRTGTELAMVWEGIRYDNDSPLDKVWKKIKLVGGSLGFTPVQMGDKLKLCVHPNLYASVMDLTNEQKILEIARQWSAFTCSRSGGSEPIPQNKPTVK